MKIGIHLPPQFGQRSPLEGGIDGEPEVRSGSGFEQLLEAMRLAMGEQSCPDGRAAALAPEIGTHSQAFENAQLLVGTALDLRGWDLPGREGEVRPFAERHRDIVGRVRDLLETLAAHVAQPLHPHAGDGQYPPAPVAGDPGVAGPGPMADGPAPKIGRVNSARGAVAFGSNLAAARTEAALRPAPEAPRARSRGSAAKSSGPALSEADAGRQSRFAAQLLATEGGLRVMLRLPRLSDGERGELEARLGQLLEAFGHRRREIVIQEIGTA